MKTNNDDLKDFKFPCTYKPGRNSKEFEDSIDEILREKYPEKFKKFDREHNI
jgi:putative lipoic acid-binding regulatory protein